MGLKDVFRDYKTGKEMRIKKETAEKVARLFSEADEKFQPTPEVRFGINIAKDINKAVSSLLDDVDAIISSRKLRSTTSLDTQYSVDRLAEKIIKRHFQQAWKEGINYGYVTEDQGLVLPPSGKADLIYLIDPVDGSRMIDIGEQNGTVTMVGVPGDIPNPTFGDIKFAITAPLSGNFNNVAYHSKEIDGSQAVIQFATTPMDGVDITINHPLIRRKNLDYSLESCSLVHEAYSASPQIAGAVIEDIIPDIAFKVEFPSGSYGLLQVMIGQHHLYVDARKRLFDEFPHLPIQVGATPKAAQPMDIAAGWFMLRALGGKITDAYGNDLDNLPLWSLNDQNQWTHTSEVSIIAAVTPTLHAELLRRVNNGIARVKRSGTSLLRRHGDHQLFPNMD